MVASAARANNKSFYALRIIFVIPKSGPSSETQLARRIENIARARNGLFGFLLAGQNLTSAI